MIARPLLREGTSEKVTSAAGVGEQGAPEASRALGTQLQVHLREVSPLSLASQRGFKTCSL